MNELARAMARNGRIVPVVALAVGVLAAGAPQASAAGAAIPAAVAVRPDRGRTLCPPGWTVVPSFSPGNLGNTLSDVVSLAMDDAWAVGNQTSDTSGRITTTTLIQHWDGSAWSVVSSPQMKGGTLAGVHAVSSTNIWAVGSVLTGLTESVPLILHYDGVRWTKFPSPQIPFGNLLAVSGVSEVDIWAVGMVRGFTPHMLVERFDGTRWKVQPTPSIDSAFISLESVSAISAADVWAVGYYLAPTFFDTTLSVHYDGAHWEIVPTPPVGPEGGELFDVAAVNDQNVWAVGRDTGNAGSEPLAIQWNGSQWTTPAPAIGEAAQLNAVAAGPRGHMLAVGSMTDGQGNEHTLIERYRDQSWKIVPSPDAGVDNRLWAVAITPAAPEAWTVGEYDFHTAGKTLTERICR